MKAHDVGLEGSVRVVPRRSSARAARRRPALLHHEDVRRAAGEEPVTRELSRLERFALRAINVAVAGTALLVLSPLIVFIAILIRLDSRGPVLYRQLRIGLDRRGNLLGVVHSGRRADDIGGRPFTIYKFRTMHADAENGTGPVWASRDDARTTRVGYWLRRYRLDEIPQFWNVLRGEMSVVGPRPERPIFVRKLRYEIDSYRLRHRVPPGITGWAQVNQGADLCVDDVRLKVSYDLDYVRRRSVMFDLLIMLKTLPVMFARGICRRG